MYQKFILHKIGTSTLLGRALVVHFENTFNYLSTLKPNIYEKTLIFFNKK